MANLKEIRTRITSVESTMQITSAMKMVSAAKFKRAQDAIIQMRPFAKKFNEILQNVSSTAGETDHPMMQKNNGKKVLLIAISSNRGLCGGFNNNVVKEIKKTIKQNPENQYSILTIGKKAHDAFKKTDLINSSEILPLNAQTIWDNLSYENSVSITSKIIDAFNENIFDKAYLIYNSFKNAAIQITVNESFLPVSSPNENIISPVDYIFEQDQ